MKRTANQLATDRQTLLAALEETPVRDGYPGLWFDQLVIAASGTHRHTAAEMNRFRVDVRALVRAGKVTEVWHVWTWCYRIAVPADQDAREDAAEVDRLYRGWVPADADQT